MDVIMNILTVFWIFSHRRPLKCFTLKTPIPLFFYDNTRGHLLCYHGTCTSKVWNDGCSYTRNHLSLIRFPIWFVLVKTLVLWSVLWTVGCLFVALILLINLRFLNILASIITEETMFVEMRIVAYSDVFVSLNFLYVSMLVKY